MAGEAIVFQGFQMKRVLAALDGPGMAIHAGDFRDLVGAMGLVAGGATKLLVSKACAFWRG